MPVLLRERGFVFRFRALDGAEPPHVHITGNGGRAKIWLQTLEMVSVRRYDARQRASIRDVTEEHRREWLATWDRFFGGH